MEMHESDMVIVRIVSPELAEKANVEIGSIHEAWKLDASGENSWMDEDGRQYAYDVWVCDFVDEGDPPEGWYAHADEVEVVGTECDCSETP